jgi:hypothetical protein
MQKVIPRKSKAYRALAVNHIHSHLLLRQRHQALVHASLEVGKDYILCLLRWAGHDFERPGRCRNLADLDCLDQTLQRVAQGCQLVVARKPTGILTKIALASLRKAAGSREEGR